MTVVRQAAAERKGARKAATSSRSAAKSVSRGGQASGSPRRASRVAQVRLQADELEALQNVMRQLHLPSTSEALREGIRLLVREAAEISAAENIRGFYGEQPAPLPEGVIPATEQELAAADAEQW